MNERDGAPSLAPVRLSVVIPAFDEEARLGETLRKAHAYLERQAYAWELLVVDDGSADGTARLVRESFPWAKLLSYHPNRGKGHAVRTGMLEARGAYRVFYDADGSTPIEEIDKLWPAFEAGHAVVIGSRSLPESNVEVHQAWLRENMGRIFNLLLRILGLTRFPDTQCGFKGFTAEAADRIFPRQMMEGFGFDVELLFLARKAGFRVGQVPVRWLNSPRSTVKVMRDPLRMIFEAIRIRLNSLLGRYT